MVERQPSKLNVIGSNPIFRLTDWNTSVLTSPREKRIGIQPAWERGGNPLGTSPADEQGIFPILCSSAVEPSTVNRLVAGSNPAGGALLE